MAFVPISQVERSSAEWECQFCEQLQFRESCCKCARVSDCSRFVIFRMPSQQSAMYPPANGYYYPYYYTPTVQISPQGANYQYAPCYYPQQSGMDSQTLMNQFAQFMSMMSSGMLPQQPPMQPVPS